MTASLESQEAQRCQHVELEANYGRERVDRRAKAGGWHCQESEAEESEQSAHWACERNKTVESADEARGLCWSPKPDLKLVFRALERGQSLSWDSPASVSTGYEASYCLLLHRQEGKEIEEGEVDLLSTQLAEYSS